MWINAYYVSATAILITYKSDKTRMKENVKKKSKTHSRYPFPFWAKSEKSRYLTPCSSRNLR